MFPSKSLYALALGSVGIVGALSNVSAQAVTLAYGSPMSIISGVPSFFSDGSQKNVAAGSWFAMDVNGNAAISGGEKVPLQQGTTGIVIGATYSPGASHSGNPTGGDTNAITAPWSFFGNTGSDYAAIPVTGSTEYGLNMSGWKSVWGGVTTFDLGTGAWDAGFTNGIANFTFNTVSGFYTLDYRATVPIGEPAGFGGVKYALHLEGYCLTPEGVCTSYATPTPEASTYGMMLAGLGLVGVAVRRRRQFA